MLYRRQPSRQRRYLHGGAAANQPAVIAESPSENIELDLSDRIDIPLPNNLESTVKPENDNRSFNGILKTIMNRISMEDIILIGLIFLLMQDGIEDEFLIILLVYILLT